MPITHCAYGHEFTKENTTVVFGRRQCGLCQTRRREEYAKKRKEQLWLVEHRSIDGPGSANKKKTHCNRGHPYSGDNLYVGPGGSRYCKTCRRDYSRKYREKQREVITLPEVSISWLP